MKNYTKHTVVLTGASRGLGEAMARILIEHGVRCLICISRSENTDLLQAAQEAGTELRWMRMDLGDVGALASAADTLFAELAEDTPDAVALINNAAVVEPIARIGTWAPADLLFAQNVNALAPSLLANAFVKAFDETDADRRIINISSGLGTRAMAGVGSYCMSKAALNMLTHSITADQADRARPIYAVAVSPGTVESHMQEALRASDESALPDRGVFVGLHENGELYTPDFSAERILTLLTRTDIAGGSVLKASDLG